MTLLQELVNTGKVSLMGDMCVLWVTGGIIEEGSTGIILTDEQIESLKGE